MKETYYLKDKKETACVEPSGYQRDKRGRLQFFCHCAICGIKKVRYVKMGGVPPPIAPLQTKSKTRSKGKKKLRKSQKTK